jgi:hypothetical protein
MICREFSKPRIYAVWLLFHSLFNSNCAGNGRTDHRVVALSFGIQSGYAVQNYQAL